MDDHLKTTDLICNTHSLESFCVSALLWKVQELRKVFGNSCEKYSFISSSKNVSNSSQDTAVLSSRLEGSSLEMDRQ